MKCPYCGGEVGLEERFCSYCGRPNEQAQRHHQDMARFRKQYAETEAECKPIVAMSTETDA